MAILRCITVRMFGKKDPTDRRHVFIPNRMYVVCFFVTCHKRKARLYWNNSQSSAEQHVATTTVAKWLLQQTRYTFTKLLLICFCQEDKPDAFLTNCCFETGSLNQRSRDMEQITTSLLQHWHNPLWWLIIKLLACSFSVCTQMRPTVWAFVNLYSPANHSLGHCSG